MQFRIKRKKHRFLTIFWFLLKISKKIKLCCVGGAPKRKKNLYIFLRPLFQHVFIHAIIFWVHIWTVKFRYLYQTIQISALYIIISSIDLLPLLAFLTPFKKDLIFVISLHLLHTFQLKPHVIINEPMSVLEYTQIRNQFIRQKVLNNIFGNIRLDFAY